MNKLCTYLFVVFINQVTSSSKVNGNRKMQANPFSESLDSAEYLTLTPVNLKTLRSPSKEDRMNSDVNDIGYQENFNLISKQLQNLLKELDVIYHEIGYSNIEILNKEKQIFHSLSNSISKFFHDANSERARLSQEHQAGQETLQCMLMAAHDPKGLNTIPDLFMRNSVLGNIELVTDENCISPQRSSSSLLKKMKTLNNAKEYVLDAYVPKFLLYLQTISKLRQLMDKLPDMESQLIPENLDLPSGSTCKDYIFRVECCKGDSQILFQFFLREKGNIFHKTEFLNLSSSRIKTIEAIIQGYQEEYERRKAEITNLQKELEDISPLLEVDYRLELPSELTDIGDQPSNSPITWANVEKLQHLVEKYDKLKKIREEEKLALIEKCQLLWNKLKIPSKQQQKFLEDNSGLSIKILQNLRSELLNLETMKKKLIKELIQNSWERIQEYWTAMCFEEKETAEFSATFKALTHASTSLQDDENVLELCETEIDILKNKMAIYEPIWKLISEFKSLQSDRIRLEESTKDSSRLLARNSHKILLEEERTRKRIVRHFPSVITELKSKLTLFEQEFKRSFILDGVRLMELVLEQETELMSKYPRSRLNLKPPPKLRAKRETSDLVTGSNSPSRCLKKGVSARKVDKTNFDKALKSRNPRNTTPKQPHSLINSNNHCNTTHIPKLTRHDISSKNFYHPTKPITSTLVELSQLSESRMNITDFSSQERTRLKFGMLSSSQESLQESAGKRSINQGSEKRFLTGKIPSSPIKESPESVYKIIQVGEGRIKLNVSPSNTVRQESSFLDENNYIEWKNSQLTKVNDENVNWENDVF